MIKIGLTGTISSGKTTIRDCFSTEKIKHEYTSLSDIVREEATKRNTEHTRENLQNVGDDLRKNNGAGVLAIKTLEKIKNYNSKVVLIDGIRNPGEIEVLKKSGDFFLLALDAPFEVRYSRAVDRARESDPKVRNEFKQKDLRDRGFNQPKDGQQVEKCMESADYTIWNEKRRELKLKDSHIFQKVMDFYSIITAKSKRDPFRPTFEELFMYNAYVISSRGTCERRKIGSVLAKDNHMISEGYNGQIPGSPLCKDIESPLGDGKKGGLRNVYNVPSGERHELCWAVHAEKNAILQAAKHGIVPKDTTIYTTASPCSICAKDLITAGVAEIIYHAYYPDQFTEKLIDISKIKMRRVEGVTKNMFHNVFLEKMF